MLISVNIKCEGRWHIHHEMVLPDDASDEDIAEAIKGDVLEEIANSDNPDKQ
ncbi:hypothetical protein ACI2KR_06810 [Pseudomonas luteola]